MLSRLFMVEHAVLLDGQCLDIRPLFDDGGMPPEINIDGDALRD
jgi:hypothetical protein